MSSSVLSPEALELIDRVMAARAAYAAAGLSRRVANILIGLGYWYPGSLIGVEWEDRVDRPGLGARVMAARGCGPATLKELRSFHNWHW